MNNHGTIFIHDVYLVTARVPIASAGATLARLNPTAACAVVAGTAPFCCACAPGLMKENLDCVSVFVLHKSRWSFHGVTHPLVWVTSQLPSQLHL